MNRVMLVYNALIVSGLTCVGVGIGMRFGVGEALIAVGAITIVLTVYVADRMLLRRGG